MWVSAKDNYVHSLNTNKAPRNKWRTTHAQFSMSKCQNQRPQFLNFSQTRLANDLYLPTLCKNTRTHTGRNIGQVAAGPCQEMLIRFSRLLWGANWPTHTGPGQSDPYSFHSSVGFISFLLHKNVTKHVQTLCRSWQVPGPIFGQCRYDDGRSTEPWGSQQEGLILGKDCYFHQCNCMHHFQSPIYFWG